MRKKVKLFFIITYGSVCAICAGLYLYNHFFENPYPILRNNKYVISFAAAFLTGLIRVLIRNTDTDPSRVYQHAYAEIINTVFDTNKKAFKKLLRAIDLYNADQYEKAAAMLKMLIPLCKTKREEYAVNFFLALNYSDMPNLEKAIEVYESLIQTGLADSRVYSNLAVLYADSSNAVRAEALYKKALFSDPENDTAHSNLAYTYFHARDYDTAVQYAKKAIEINASCVTAIKLLVIIHTITDNHEQADRYTKMAIAHGVSKKALRELLDYYVGGEER